MITIYPILKNMVAYGYFILSGDPSETKHFYFEDRNGTEIEVSSNLYHTLVTGSNPLKLKNAEDKRMLRILCKHGIIQTRRFVNNGIINQFIIRPIATETIKKYRNIYRILNAFLPILSILMFVCGVVMRIMFSPGIECIDMNFLMYFAGLFISIVCHEMGHFIAGAAYSYKITDVGLLLLGHFPIGAYVSSSEKADENTNKREKIQFYLAGIEAQVFIIGVCLILSVVFYPISFTLLAIADTNLLMAFVNLLPSTILELDGAIALNEMVEVKNFCKISKKFVFNKDKRKKLLKSGLNGYMAFIFLLLPTISDVILLCIFGYEIITFISLQIKIIYEVFFH